MMINKIIQNNLIPENQFIYGTADLRGLIDKKFSNFQCYGFQIPAGVGNRIIKLFGK